MCARTAPGAAVRRSTCRPTWPLVGWLAVTAPLLGEPCRFPFVDVTSAAGVVFRHLTGSTGEKHLPETMGSGVAWLDYDGDGWLDLYLVQSGPYPPDGSAAAANRLFRNLGGGTFVAVPDDGAAAHRGYGQGVLAGDLDGDGDVDLYLTNVGDDALLRNRGDGSFAPVALPPAGGEAINWGSSSSAADGDGDGDLDLYVARYVEYDPGAALFCGEVETGERIYCDPTLFLGQPDRYLRNRGDGSFEEASAEAGIAAVRGRGLGVAFVDLDGDHAPDLYVANDLTLNLLYRNLGNGRFEEVGLLAGAAVNADGKPEAGMGVAVGDYDRDGDADLAITNFDVETNTLYRNLSVEGAPLFEDVSATSGFGLPSFNRLGFGIVDGDLDGDGHLDLYVANGHIFERPKRENVDYRQPDLLLAGAGGGRFVAERCRWLEADPRVARGLAGGDFDNDGDLDLVLSHSGGEPALLRNGAEPLDWVGVELVSAVPNRQAVGAEVVLDQGDRGSQKRWVVAGGSYQSSSDRRQLFGLGGGEAERLEVRWPDGSRRRIRSPPTGRYLRIVHPR